MRENSVTVAQFLSQYVLVYFHDYFSNIREIIKTNENSSEKSFILFW